MNFHEMQAITQRTRSSGKPNAYYKARAFDEALGGALGNTEGLARLTAWYYWLASGATVEQGKRGGFNLSIREVKRCESQEKLMIHRGDQIASVQRGPDGGHAAFTLEVRKAHAVLHGIILGTTKLAAWVPGNTSWTMWNEAEKESPVDGDKGRDTFAYPIVAEWTEKDITDTVAWLNKNLIEGIEVYEYHPPTNQQ